MVSTERSSAVTAAWALFVAAIAALATRRVAGRTRHLRDKGPLARWPLALFEPGAGAVF